jgi:hypothetical protein
VSGYFAGVVKRLFGVDPTLRPVTNRYLAARRIGDVQASLPSSALEEHDGPQDAIDDRSDSAARPSTLARSADVQGVEAPQGVGTRRRQDEVAPSPGSGRSERGARSATIALERVLAEQPTQRETRNEAAGSRVVKARTFATEAMHEARLLPPESVLAAVPPARLRDFSPGPAGSDSTTVHVHIGRIDVRAVEAPVPKTLPARPSMRKPSLEAHLIARDRGIA